MCRPLSPFVSRVRVQRGSKRAAACRAFGLTEGEAEEESAV